MLGNNTHKKITTTIAIKNGQLSLKNSPTEQFMIEQTEYIPTPTGGVKSPIAQVMTITTPKYTRSTQDFSSQEPKLMLIIK